MKCDYREMDDGHNRHLGMPGIMRKGHHRRWSVADLADAIEVHIKAKPPDEILGWRYIYVTKEEIERVLCAKPSVIVQALHLLNLRGVLKRRTKDPLHDSSRDYWAGGHGGFSGWAAGRYHLTKKEIP